MYLSLMLRRHSGRCAQGLGIAEISIIKFFILVRYFKPFGAAELEDRMRKSVKCPTSKRDCADMQFCRLLSLKRWGILLLGLLAIHCGSYARAQAAPTRDLATANAPWFSDVSGMSAIHYVTSNGYSGRKYFPQPMCGGVAAFDFDKTETAGAE